MTALEYMEKQLKKHRLNYDRSVERAVPQQMLEDIRAKIGYYEDAVNALKSVCGSSRWKWICPVCKKEIEEEYTVDEVRDYVGATHNCPECNGLVMIEEDLTCSDFGNELVKRYADMGLNVSKEEASNSHITLY